MYFKTLLNKHFDKIVTVYIDNSLAKIRLTSSDASLAERKRGQATALLTALNAIEFSAEKILSDYKDELLDCVEASNKQAESATQTLNQSGTVIIPRENSSYANLATIFKEFINYIFLNISRDVYLPLSKTTAESLEEDIHLAFKSLILNYSADSFIHRRCIETNLVNESLFNSTVNQQKINAMEEILQDIDATHAQLRADTFKQNMKHFVNSARLIENEIQTRQTSTPSSRLFFDCQKIFYKDSTLAKQLEEFHSNHWDIACSTNDGTQKKNLEAAPS